MTERVSPAAQRRTIVQLSVSGYKSIRGEQSIEIRPLTILAGANSSGKSSIIQPLLLLKQTLEATYDPGPLLLDGPDVRFSRASQLFFTGKGHREDHFHVGIAVENGVAYTLHFTKGEKKQGLQLSQMEIRLGHSTLAIEPPMASDNVKEALSKGGFRELVRELRTVGSEGSRGVTYEVVRNRCFLDIRADGVPLTFRFPSITEAIQSVIHLPGLRGNPTRTYPVTAVGRMFPGTFQDYTASVIRRWQDEKSNKSNLQSLGQDLQRLGLTWKVEAKRSDDTKVELRVGRTRSPARGGAQDMVNVADVGFGVSQTLPVLVALRVAYPGQLVYIEQPEIHLHPRAQVKMASILADAAQRGVRVVAETHSSLLLLAIQALVARGELSPDLVKLHWFQRDEGGETHITSADLDEAGAFGDWPEDFGQVELEIQQRYLDAAETKATTA
jgi:predicted ATPase